MPAAGVRLSELENRALHEIAARFAQGDIVRAQVASAEVDQRERRACGVRTFFRLDAIGRHLDKTLWKTEHMPMVRARHPQLQQPASFVLVIADGFISCLEASVDCQDWPKDEDAFVFVDDNDAEKTR